MVLDICEFPDELSFTLSDIAYLRSFRERRLIRSGSTPIGSAELVDFINGP